MLCCKTLIMPLANCTEGICLGPEREFLSALGPAIVSPAQDLFRPCEVSPSLTPITFIIIIIIHTYYPASLFIQVAHCAATPVVDNRVFTIPFCNRAILPSSGPKRYIRWMAGQGRQGDTALQIRIREYPMLLLTQSFYMHA